MKTLSIIFSIILLSLIKSSLAQDIIETKSGDKIRSKVVHVGDTDIKYKKHDNIMGPMLTIAKLDVVVINFANGTIKRFVELPKPVNKMLQPENYKVNNSNKSVVWEYLFDPEPVFNGATIFYYGLNISHMAMIDPVRMEQDALLRSYLPLWHDKFNSVITDELLKRGMRTTKVEMKNIKTQFTHEAIGSDWIKSNSQGLAINDVITIVEVFGETIELQEGVGLLFISDIFDKPKNTAHLITVFFDAMTKEILWASKVKGVANDKDLVKKWGLGMVQAYQQFRLEVYEYEYKKYIKTKYNSK